MFTPAQKPQVLHLHDLLLSALNELKQIHDSTPDVDTKEKLTDLIELVSEMITALANAQVEADDDAFMQDTQDLKEQASDLQNEAAQIQQIVQIAGQIGQVLGWITQATAIIATF